MPEFTLSVVIPAYNEEDAIVDVIRDMKTTLGTVANWKWEVVVVDDGSSDRTAELAESAGARVIRHPVNKGYGAALKTGIWSVESDFICITDADGTYPTKRLPELLAAIETGADMAVGQRTGKAYWSSMIKNPLRVIYMWLCSFAAGGAIPDGNSGLRVFRRDIVIENESHLCMGFSFTTTLSLMMVASSRDVRWLKIDYLPRVGKTKVRLLKDGLRTSQFILQAILRYNPVKLALLPTAFLATVGLFFFLWSLLDSRFHYSMGALILAICICSSAICFGIGCLGYINQKGR